MIKVWAVLIAIISAIYAGAVYNGHEPSTAGVILDQAFISILVVMWAWGREQ